MVSMPAVIVLIVCKVAIAGPPDQNANQTGAQNLQWATEHSMMVCRRHEIPVMDMAAEQGADPVPFSTQQCQRSAMMLGPAWDQSHRSSRWRFWRAACPVPIMSVGPDGVKGTRDDVVIGYSLPECGKRDIARCEVDTAI